eukprot:TRINITY_DN9689_c0_g1_i1.p1 TRINITY_DN9689_c0_g1~~TRINITY_DN9689_c0_g1_i1.p1  ORF type:complete len:204 (+),score=30.19 TRINITY_DN9689_c0_g1_i1:157-768(+)
MTCNQTLLSFSDSGFSKEQTKGYAIRGSNFMRQGKALRDGLDHRKGDTIFHLIDSQCQSYKHVTRSTFSAETSAMTATIDNAYPLLITLQELCHGCLTKEAAKQLRETGGLVWYNEVIIDAMSVFAAITAAVPKPPSEKNLAGHLYWTRQLIDKQIIKRLRWSDTRDMNADCHTKGSVERSTILALMAGYFVFKHSTKAHPPD